MVRIERHPQYKQILKWIAEGEDAASISRKLKPPVSRVSVWRFIRNRVKSATDAPQAVVDALKEKGYLPEDIPQAELDEAVIKATTTAIAAAPMLSAKNSRLAALEDRHERMRIVMDERAEEMAGVPGGRSGLLVRQIKQVGQGDNAQIVEEYKLDTGLLSEFREHEKQAAMELGQWQETAGRGPTDINIALLIPRALEPAPLPKSQDVEFRQIGPEDPE